MENLSSNCCVTLFWNVSSLLYAREEVCSRKDMNICYTIEGYGRVQKGHGIYFPQSGVKFPVLDEWEREEELVSEHLFSW